MTSLPTSPTRIVYTLYGPKTVDKSDPHPFGPPLPGAPVFRQTFPASRAAWSLDNPPPYVASINQSDSARRGTRHNSAPYARSSHRPTQTVPPTPPNSAGSSHSPTWQDARRGCAERIQLELSALSIIEANAIGAAERERDRYKMAAEVARRDLRRVTEERDVLRDKFEALSLKTSDGLSSGSPSTSNCNDFVQKFSSAGPLRRNSIPRSFLRAESAPAGHSRCKTTSPYLLSRGVNDCFDVTLVGRSLPPQREYSRITKSEPSSPDLIRDASRPHEGPRQCLPVSKPGEIDFDHVDILYIPYNGRVFCRACHVNRHKTQNFDTVQVKNFPNNASWDELRAHYLLVHPSESQEIANLTMPQVVELRRRLREKQSSSP